MFGANVGSRDVTPIAHRQDALTSVNIHSRARAFADTFGENRAYIGFSHTEGHAVAYDYGVELLRLLKGNTTVSKALDDFDEDATEQGIFKGYGVLDQVIDVDFID